MLVVGVLGLMVSMVLSRWVTDRCAGTTDMSVPSLRARVRVRV